MYLHLNCILFQRVISEDESSYDSSVSEANRSAQIGSCIIKMLKYFVHSKTCDIRRLYYR